MKIQFAERAREDYFYWQKNDRATIKRINELIHDIQRLPYDDIESLRLKHALWAFGLAGLLTNTNSFTLSKAMFFV